MDPTLSYAAGACALVIALTYALGLATKEHSWVDRAWSILPVLYVGFFAYRASGAPARLVVMTALVFAWGARLTYNFARKGGYAKGGEDYRWPVLRRRMSGWQWQLFALFFVAGVQNVILLSLTLPAWIAGRAGARPFGALDLVATALFVAFLVGETIADQEQWAFHQRKKDAAARGETLEPPFCTTGLFRYSRHPNFFCEQAMWWTIYLFSVASTGAWINASIAGPIVLTLLFHGSTRFTEEITLSKYPAYADYQARTSRLVPFWPSRGAADRTRSGA